MISERSWTIYCQKYPVYTGRLALVAKLSPLWLYDEPFSRYKGGRKSEMYRITSDPEHLTVKSTLYTLSIYPQCPIFVEYLILNIYPQCPHFALRPAIFEIWCCGKLEVYQRKPDWPWTLNYHKHPAYTEDFPSRPRFHSVLLCVAPIRDNTSFVFLYVTMVNVKVLGKKHRKKIENSKCQKSKRVICENHWDEHSARCLEKFKSDLREG